MSQNSTPDNEVMASMASDQEMNEPVNNSKIRRRLKRKVSSDSEA
jgi:hypothetical protein